MLYTREAVSSQMCLPHPDFLRPRRIHWMRTTATEVPVAWCICSRNIVLDGAQIHPPPQGRTRFGLGQIPMAIWLSRPIKPQTQLLILQRTPNHKVHVAQTSTIERSQIKSTLVNWKISNSKQVYPKTDNNNSNNKHKTSRCASYTGYYELRILNVQRRQQARVAANFPNNAKVSQAAAVSTAC